jgi:hypothetical protein
MNSEVQNAQPLSLSQWRPVFWEPVAGTGERLMAGVVGQHGDDWHARRTIRDDVLESLYGASSDGTKKLIEEALQTALFIVKRSGLESLKNPILGLSPGTLRRTSAVNFSEVARQAALLYSSLTNLDAIDGPDEDISPRSEDGNRQFGREVREIVAALQPNFKASLQGKARLVKGGDLVRFGFLSSRTIIHFAVLHPVRQSGSVTAARSKLFELEKARSLNGSLRAALIIAVPHDDAAIFGEKQRANLLRNKEELLKESRGINVAFSPVTTVIDGANAVIAFEGV